MSDYVQTEVGLLVPEHAAIDRLVTEKRRPKAVDLFCGCGGFSLGMIQAGWEVVAAVDYEADAIHTYMSNLGAYPCQFHFGTKADRDRMEKCLAKSFKAKGDQVEIFDVAGSGYRAHHPEWPGVAHMFMADIRSIKGRDILDAIGLEVGELDAVCGSPPCQGFSHAGKRNVADPRNNLMFEFARLVVEMRPKTMVLENAPGIASMVTPEGLPVLDLFARIIEDGSFATADAIRASLKAQLGVAIMRNVKKRTSRRRSKKRKAA